MANKIQEELTQLYEETCSEFVNHDTIEEEDCNTLMETIITSDIEDEHDLKEEILYENVEDVFDDENRVKRQYRRKKNLDEGLIVGEVDGMKIYQCDVCKKWCKDRYKLKAHRAIHTTERSICCNECGSLWVCSIKM